MAVQSGISKIVSSQIGPLQGKLRSDIQKKVLELLKEFANGCPDPEATKRIISTRNNLLKAIDSFQRRVDTIRPIADSLSPVISVAKAAIEVLVNLPIPTAIIPPTTGGVGVPMSVLNRYSRTIGMLTSTVDVLEADVKAVKSITTSVVVPIRTLRDSLKSIDQKVAECSKNNPNIAAAAQPPQNSGTEGTPRDALGNPDPDYSYKGYTLAVVQDPNSPKIAPKRYAIAKNSSGTVVLYGESSFSSDVKVLLDEIKFRIDNQLA
jgi:hypothetical protein